MTDFESRLREEVTRRTQGFSPSPDLPDRIHAQVRRRRRRRAMTTGGLSAGAVAVVAVLGLLLTRSPDTGDDVVASGDRPPSTAPPSTTSPPSTTAGTPATEPESTTEGTAAPPPSSTPPTSATTATTAPTTTTAPDLKPPDSMQPAAGTCAQPTQPVVEVVIHPDIPSPRCTRVTPEQRLQVRNDTDQEVTVSLDAFTATLAPGATQADDRAFGDYLQPGVHRISVTLYGSSGPEIWLSP
jgi:hypothetical protein